MQIISFLFGVGLVALWIAGLVNNVPQWYAWLDMIGAVFAFAIAAGTPSKLRVRRVRGGGACVGLAVGLFAIWLLALRDGAPAWIAWGNFTLACAFLLTGIGSLATPDEDILSRRQGTYGSFFGVFPGGAAGDMGSPYGSGYGFGPFNPGVPTVDETVRAGGYPRMDALIEEEITERFSRHWSLDASDIDVSVEDGVVTLEGSAGGCGDRKLAEGIVDAVMGVKGIQNRLSVRHDIQAA